MAGSAIQCQDGPVMTMGYIRFRDMARWKGSFDPVVMALHRLEVRDDQDPLQGSVVIKGPTVISDMCEE